MENSHTKTVQMALFVCLPVRLFFYSENDHMYSHQLLQIYSTTTCGTQHPSAKSDPFSDVLKGIQMQQKFSQGVNLTQAVNFLEDFKLKCINYTQRVHLPESYCTETPRAFSTQASVVDVQVDKLVHKKKYCLNTNITTFCATVITQTSQ